MGDITFDKYSFTKDNLEEQINKFFEDVKEKQKLLNLLHSPCENLYHVLQYFYRNIIKREKVESIMLDFMEHGYSYKKIESEETRIMPKSNQYSTSIFQKPGILDAKEMIIKILNCYLILVVESADESTNTTIHYSIAKDEEGVTDFFCSVVKDKIKEKFIR